MQPLREAELPQLEVPPDVYTPVHDYSCLRLCRCGGNSSSDPTSSLATLVRTSPASLWDDSSAQTPGVTSYVVQTFPRLVHGPSATYDCKHTFAQRPNQYFSMVTMVGTSPGSLWTFQVLQCQKAMGSRSFSTCSRTFTSPSSTSLGGTQLHPRPARAFSLKVGLSQTYLSPSVGSLYAMTSWESSHR